ncbi:MAG: hypothetical protein WD025_00320 [Bacteriovoracaceae bacterium]
MKRLLQTLIAMSFLGAFSVSAFATGMDHVSTDGAICSDREAGKNVNGETSGSDDSNGSTADNN